MNKWNKKLLLGLTFYISLVREILFSSGKSQRILKNDVCSKHDKAIEVLPTADMHSFKSNRTLNEDG